MRQALLERVFSFLEQFCDIYNMIQLYTVAAFDVPHLYCVDLQLCRLLCVELCCVVAVLHVCKINDFQASSNKKYIGKSELKRHKHYIDP